VSQTDTRADTEDAVALHPRETTALFGHAEAEQNLLESYKSGRIPHAWLIGGPPGIGKATLAYRMARFVLAHPDPRAAQVQSARTLAIAPDNAVARRIAAQAHGGLLTLERVINENTGKLYTVIRVEDVRRTISFFGSTATEGGWRVCIVDNAGELQYPQASNALLKVLEEPPSRALFLLVSHAPGRLLPTIRSRCRRLALRPLEAADVARAIAAATGRDANAAEVRDAAAASDGSVARALGFLDGPALALRQRVLDLLAQLPDPDPRALHALGDSLNINEPQTLAAFIDMVNVWLGARLDAGVQDAGRMTQQKPAGTPADLARLSGIWDKINRAARDADTYNLERKPLVFAVFGFLAEAARSQQRS
jgi:DNA polymerase-3 subunit delta'